MRQAAGSAHVGAGYDMDARAQTLLLLDGTPSQGRGVEELEKALREQVVKLRDELVSDDELKRVKAQVVASDVYQRDSVFYQAMRIGSLEALGLGWRLIDEYVARIRAVTPEQVREVARKYLADDHLTVAVLDPQPFDKERARQMPQRTQQGGDQVRYRGDAIH